MARIVIVSQFFPPEPFSGANRVASLANALAETNDVIVVTLEPSYPDPTLYDPEAVWRVDEVSTYPIRRRFAMKRHPRSLFARALREQMMALRLAFAAARERPADVLLTSSPSMFLGPAVRIASVLTSTFFIWDIRDITWRLTTESFVRSQASRLAAAILERLMWWTARSADLVLVATEGASETLRSKRVEQKKLLLIPNAISSQLLKAANDVRETSSRAKPTVTYVGLLGYPQGLSVMIEAASQLQDVDFLLVGDGPERDLLQTKAEALRLENVTFTGFLGRDAVLDVYSGSDILFAQLKDSPTLNSATIPSKVFEYMAVGKPFIYAGRGLAVEMLDEIGCAVTIPPSDPQELCSAICILLENRDRMRELGARGAAYARQNLRREDVMGQFADTLRERIGGNHGRGGPEHNL